MRRFLLLAAALGLTLAPAASTAGADSSGAREWRVTIQNLTGAQTLSAPLLVVHGKQADVWEAGTIANHGVAAIAEDGNTAVLESALPGLPGIRQVRAGAEGIPPGQTRTYSVNASGAHDRLSIVTMLVDTNDGFTGLDAVQFRNRGYSVDAPAYDAGSERNNELRAFIPGPCCGSPFARDPEGQVIRPHAGIAGVGDLDPAVWGWTGPVARITVAPVR